MFAALLNVSYESFKLHQSCTMAPSLRFPLPMLSSLSPSRATVPISAFVDFLLLGWDTKINVRKSFPLHFSSCHFSSPWPPFFPAVPPISIRFSATLVTRRRGTMEKDQLDDSGLPFARRYHRVNFILLLSPFTLARACGWSGNIKLHLLTLVHG